MTITTRNAISACIAFVEIWLPQLAPGYWTLIWPGARVSGQAIACHSAFRRAGVSRWVCRVQVAVGLGAFSTCWTVARAPPPAPLTVLRTGEMKDNVAGSSEAVPPFK